MGSEFGAVMASVADSEYAKRQVIFYQARHYKLIDEERYNRVLFNLLDKFKSSGELRTDRPCGERAKITPDMPKSRIRAIEKSNRGLERAMGRNYSDEKWLEDLQYFTSEAGLEMDEYEQSWFQFLFTGKLSSQVSKCIKQMFEIQEGEGGETAGRGN